ncbi:malectin domain-containing carbohydrate-binding protein [Flaviaesturariibacter aridisoli]|uniref:T9SS type A sorting domain-containing protein n=1 Tax=Flaviaesturariibacter aridisoli TaxID=2545761 RepID=A0A4R4DVD4_9BACT|nr:malectin domain-containing carbohydrate-binding protein [Flaviaesturariibacter aridisoli]TCZ67480.1 T9SS type A sorting domain-containing protein [Flaviaesturariibacter aridisoli]
MLRQKICNGIGTLACLLLSFLVNMVQAQYSFSSSGLKLVNGATVFNPTSLQFGPDGRLYIAEQAGFIRVHTIRRNGPNDYSTTAFETISLINSIPNHNDDGTVNAAETHRQITGILVKGTAANPVIYVSSSDYRAATGAGLETNLDTNSGILSMLTWNGSAWVKIDLVRGLPRSEEYHSVNGMQLDDQTNTLFLAVGGFTNAGSPSTNFNYTNEYALAAAVLSIKLNTIMAMPTKGSGNNTYKYDLPTLDDPTRPNNPDGSDPNDPFGGNDGLNQAMLVAGGPVQIYSSGYRNAYDLVLTKARRLYTIDNGANQGWGGYPAGEGTANVTNNYVPGEPGSTGPTATEGQVNNLDNFHYIGNIDTYVPGSFYGGHPCPIRANPAGAGLYTHNGTTGVFRNSTSGPNPLPANWPPVPVSMADPRQGDFKMPGTEDGAPLTFTSSTNGITEYTASNFNGALKGCLLAAEYNGAIAVIKLTADGTGVTNARDPLTKLNQEPDFASNFGATPIDLVAQGDNDPFPGTVWALTYGADAVTIFEPQSIGTCTGANNTTDEDGDGYTNADEIANGTNPCSGASKPADFDGDHISDLNDPDDDNDGINDKTDAFAIDASNGSTRTLPVNYDLFNNDPGTGFFGVGFTGLMSNHDSDYQKLYNNDNLIAGGAIGAFSVVDVPAGDALGSLNTQQYGFQFGVKTNGAAFTFRSSMTGPFFNNQTPQGAQSQGIFLGNGDQDNYLKIVLNANGGAGGIQVVYENAGVVTSSQYAISGGIPGTNLELLLKYDPATGSVQPAYASNRGTAINVGAPIPMSGAVLNALRGTTILAVGIISTSSGGPAFTATWDNLYVTTDQAASTPLYRINAGGPSVTNSMGVFAADNRFSPAPGNTHSVTTAINGTTDDAIYQTERWGNSFSYALPVSNGQYKVVLHFAEIYWTAANSRVFDVSIEGVKKLDNYDIFAKVGAFTATTETFVVNVTDGTLNIAFSSLTAVGGKDNAKVSAIEVLSNSTAPPANQPPVANAGADVTITLPTSSTALNGSGTDADGTVTGYSWTQVSGPNAATFSNATAASPTVSGLVQGSYVFALVVTDNNGAPSSAADPVTVQVNGAATNSVFYRINAGGPSLTNSIGTFAADNSFAPSPGNTFSVATAIGGTTDDALYQSERWGNSFGYALPVSNGTYKVVLHFAEIYWTSANNRVFDVMIEGVKRLDNYDIFAKAGAFTATTETFVVTVTDGTLNIDFSSLTAVGGKDNAKVSAIEVLSNSTGTNTPPVANAGADKTITLPASSTTLNGSGTDGDGTVAGYTWSQVSGPNTASFSSKTLAAPTVSGLVQGTYVFALVVTDNGGASSTPDQVTVFVNAASPGQAVTSFTLINASNEQAIQDLTNETTINLATLPSRSLNIRANTSPGTVGSVVFSLSGSQTRNVSESGAPYALFGDNAGNYNAWTPAPGSYTLLATPFTGPGGSGTGGAALTLNFSVVDQATTATGRSTDDEAGKAAVRANELQLQLYPNPSRTRRVFVQFSEPLQGELSYALYTGTGDRMLVEKQVLSNATSLLELDFSRYHLANGAYYLKLTTGGRQKTVQLWLSGR